MLRLNRSESGFTVSYAGRTLFSHTLEKPMVSLGLGARRSTCTTAIFILPTR
jgi:hypothetical protein